MARFDITGPQVRLAQSVGPNVVSLSSSAGSILAGAAASFGDTTARVGLQIKIQAEQQKNAIDQQKRRLALAKFKSEYHVQMGERSSDMNNYATLTEDSGLIGKALAAKHLDGVDANTAKMLENDFAVFMAEREPHVASLSRQMGTQVGRDSLNAMLATSSEEYLSAPDDDARAEAIASMQESLSTAVKDGLINETEAKEAETKAVSRAQESFVLRDIIDNPQDAVRALRSGEFEHLDPVKRERLLAQATNRVDVLDNKARIAAEHQARLRDRAASQQRVHASSELELRVKTGDVPLDTLYAEIEGAYGSGKGWLSASKRTQLRLALDKRINSTKKEVEDFSIVEQAVMSGGGLDYRNPEHRKAGNAFFDKVVSPQLKDMEPDQAAAAVTQYVTQTMVMPQQVESMINIGLQSGDTKHAVKAMRIASALRAEAPPVIGQLPTESEAFVKHADTLMNAGVSDEVAVQSARDAVYKVTPEQKNVRRTLMSEHLKPSVLQQSVETFVEENYGETFSSDPSVTADMMVEFKNLAEAFYVASGGDPGEAVKMAKDRMKTMWGTTELGGTRRMMKKPPETMFGEGSGEWLKPQLDTDLNEVRNMKFKITNDAGQEIDTKPLLQADLTIVSDEKTLRDRNPSYRVMERTPEGLVPVENPNGVKVRWEPSFRDSDVGRKMVKDGETSVARGRRKREETVELLKAQEKQIDHANQALNEAKKRTGGFLAPLEIKVRY